MTKNKQTNKNMWISVGRLFQTKGKASSRALRWACT